MKPIHDNCRTIRDVWRYELKEIAVLFDVSYTIWGNYERGKTEPSPTVLLQMERMTGVTFKKLMTERITRDDLPKEPIIQAINEEPEPPQFFLNSGNEKATMMDIDTLPIVERLKRLEMAVFGG